MRGLAKHKKGAGLGMMRFPGRGKNTEEIQKREAQNSVERPSHDGRERQGLERSQLHRLYSRFGDLF